MATAKEISDEARVRAMSAYMDYLGRKLTPDQMRKKYGVGYSRVRQLIVRGERLCTPNQHWSYGLLTAEERKELMKIRDQIELLSGKISQI